MQAAGHVLDVLDQAQAQVESSLPTVQGRVRVAVFQSAALALMPNALHEMAVAHPDVRIEMVQREPETALHETWAREFDMVIAEQYPAHTAPHLSGLHRSDLTTDEVRLALPPVDTALAPVSSIEDAEAMPWVMEPRGTASRHFAEQVCRRWGFEPDVRYETADLQTQIRLVESGNAVSLMPDLMWTGRTTTCRLVDLPDRPRRTIFTVVRAAGSSSPAVRALRDALERAAASVHRPAASRGPAVSLADTTGPLHVHGDTGRRLPVPPGHASVAWAACPRCCTSTPPPTSPTRVRAP